MFDQSRQSAQSQHMLEIDETLYDEGDDDMQRILRRLLMAGTSAEMRHDMNVEDEYFSIIEKQDTEILMKTRELAEKTVELEEKNAQLDEKNAQLDEKSAQLDEKSAQLAKSIKLLLSAGMPPEEIAANLGVSLDTVMQLR